MTVFNSVTLSYSSFFFKEIIFKKNVIINTYIQQGCI